MTAIAVPDVPSVPVRVSLAGRFLDGLTRGEAPCTVAFEDGAILLRSEVLPAPGTAVVVYAEGLSRLTATVASRAPSQATLALTGHATLKERVMRRMAALVEQGGRIDEKRADGRFVPDERETEVRLAGDDAWTPAYIVDVSRGGVSLEAERPLPIGTRLFVGKRAATVVRRTPGGYAAEFVLGLAPADLAPGIRL